MIKYFNSGHICRKNTFETACKNLENAGLGKYTNKKHSIFTKLHLTQEQLDGMQFEAKKNILCSLEQYNIKISDYMKTLTFENNLAKDSKFSKTTPQNSLKRKRSVTNNDLVPNDLPIQSKLTYNGVGLSFESAQRSSSPIRHHDQQD